MSDFKKFRSLGIEGFTAAFQGAKEALESMDLGRSSDEPPVSIILIGTGRDINGKKEVDCYFYIGATKEQISEDLLSLGQPGEAEQKETVSTL